MRPSPAPTTLLAFLLVAASAGNGLAYKRLKYGPIELVPSLTVEVRQHSNVYVLTNDQLLNSVVGNPTAPPPVLEPRFKESGIIFDLRPAVNFIIQPANLEKKIRGLYLDFKYSPQVSLFPGTGLIAFCAHRDPGTSQCDLVGRRSNHADAFKINQNFFGTIRYQLSERLSLSTGAEYTNPELALTDLSLKDLAFHGGAKYDFSKVMGIEARVTYKHFATPVERFLPVLGADGKPVLGPDGLPLTTSHVENADFGTFHSLITDVRYHWQWLRSLSVGAYYTREHRTFQGLPFAPCADPNQFDFSSQNNANCDTLPDNGKDYLQQTAGALATKHLARHTTGTVQGGYTWRNADPRNFGSKKYAQWTAAGTIETLITKKTSLQGSAEYSLTDTIREIFFRDLNAFTSDALGQFSIIPEQFSAVRTQRYLVDLGQTITRRGDQILVGVAYQKNVLLDQIGSLNYVVPGKPILRSDCGSLAGTPQERFQAFCDPVLDDERSRLTLFTTGYRVRLKKWLGVEARATWFHGVSNTVPTKAKVALNPTAQVGPDVVSQYWSFGGGVVINLQAFQ